MHRVIIKHCIFCLMQCLDYVGAGVVLPQGPSFRLLVGQFSDIADPELISFWKSLFGDTNVVEGEEFHLDSADALRTLLE